MRKEPLVGFQNQYENCLPLIAKQPVSSIIKKVANLYGSITTTARKSLDFAYSNATANNFMEGPGVFYHPSPKVLLRLRFL
jgi:hypothetical protein